MEEWNLVDILVAEDNPADAEMTLRAFRKGGFAKKVLVVQDGADALSFIFREGQFAGRDQALPKLIMLDVQMPMVGGIQVLNRLKAHASTANIPVVILTSSAHDHSVLERQSSQVLDFAVKPLTAKSLMQVITKWIV